MNETSTADAILDFWFGAAGSVEYGLSRDMWFQKSVSFDSELRARFGGAVDAAVSGAFDNWRGPLPALARVLLLDQFTRNCYRGTARAFSGDALAQAVARVAVDSGADTTLIPVQRWFLYMPLVHAESLAAQQRSVELFTRLAEQTGLEEPLPWAKRHADVVRRFGRFPHRNAVLDRASTTEEAQFLTTQGSRF
ncbi:MAG TPA: DUF924 family protein [Casimicrobiaceae bacterium]|jgi:uncharacterized protein (DUF924 family)